MLEDYISAVEDAAARVARLMGQIEELVPALVHGRRHRHVAKPCVGWLRSILKGEEPHVRRVSSVKISFPKH